MSRIHGIASRTSCRILAKPAIDPGTVKQRAGNLSHCKPATMGKIPLRVQDPTVTPASEMWHSVAGFEPMPFDYGLLSMAVLPRQPRMGGETI